jgi:hypothetical protein
MNAILRVRTSAGNWRVEVYPTAEDAAARIWPLLEGGTTIEAMQVHGHWLTRTELLRVVERVIAKAPRPVPVAIGAALLRLMGSKRVLGP